MFRSNVLTTLPFAQTAKWESENGDWLRRNLASAAVLGMPTVPVPFFGRDSRLSESVTTPQRNNSPGNSVSLFARGIHV